MKKTVFIYGSLLAFLVAFLRFVDYRFFIRDLTLEIYVSIIAVFFTALGVWMGIKYIYKSDGHKSPDVKDFSVNTKNLKNIGISERKYEVLKAMSQGLSNSEIGEKLFVSIHTIKTHSSNLYSKLNVKRRTQAIQKARTLNLIP